jgi:hypothetical protein
MSGDTKTSVLSQRQRDILEFAAELPDERAGIEAFMPITSGDRSSVRGLVRRGFLKPTDDICRHVDTGAEDWGYVITDAGRAALRASSPSGGGR